MKKLNANEMRAVDGGFWVALTAATIAAEVWVCSSVCWFYSKTSNKRR